MEYTKEATEQQYFANFSFSLQNWLGYRVQSL